jgi:hypothetical protein
LAFIRGFQVDRIDGSTHKFVYCGLGRSDVIKQASASTRASTPRVTVPSRNSSASWSPHAAPQHQYAERGFSAFQLFSFYPKTFPKGQWTPLSILPMLHSLQANKP